ncbi:MAG: TAT-variant-translocated molybdopterin oxidoreductase [Bacteroidota bacterium]
MKELNQDTWLGVEHLNNGEKLAEMSNQEFVQLPIVEQLSEEKTLDTTSNRRDFLKYLGFGLGAATIAASCETPVRRALPYVVKPDEVIPGVATYYATAFSRGGDVCPVLIRTREGRPIKVEGNKLSKLTQGGTTARVQASVLDLYDVNRYIRPFKVESGKVLKDDQDKIDWEIADTEIKAALSKARKVYIVSNTINSPTTLRALEEFKAKYNAQHVVYDPISNSAILDANKQDFGQRLIPNYHFEKAEVIMNFGADFLGTWISPVEYSADYTKNRMIKKIKEPKMSRHIQVESFMSMTGSNADDRVIIKPSEQGAAIATLYNVIAKEAGVARINAPILRDSKGKEIEHYAKELLAHKGKSLVISGSNNVGEQCLVNAINHLLENYGATIEFNHASLQRQGSDKAILDFAKQVSSADVVIFWDDVNPVFDLPNGKQFAEALSKAKMKISFAGAPTETAEACDYILPIPHFLEAWGDAEAKRGMYATIQPTIAPLFDTRQAEATLLIWADSPNFDASAEQPCYDYMKQTWKDTIFPKQQVFQRFQAFWDAALRDGEVVIEDENTAAYTGNASIAARKINQPIAGEGLEIALFEDISVGGGQYASNPWLQELPDPVTRCTWGNYLQVPVAWDGDRSFVAYDNLNVEELYGIADKVDIAVDGHQANCIAIKSFGQRQDTFAISLGYGRQIIGKSGENIGSHISNWIQTDANGNFQYYAPVEYNGKNGLEERLACVQYHNTIGLEGEDDGETKFLDEEAATTVRKGFQGSLTKRVVIRRTNLKELNPFLYGSHGGDHGHHKEDGHHGEEGHEGEHGHGDEPKESEENKSLTQSSNHGGYAKFTSGEEEGGAAEESHGHGSMNPFAADYMGLIEERKHHQKLNDYGLYPNYQEEVYSQGHHWGLHIDLSSCTGCGACVVACQSENNIPVVGKKEVGRHHEMAWLRIDRYFYGDAENPNVVYQPMMCQHCDNAPCENVCPVAATPHNNEGLNQMAYNRCIGTRYCANNCPYKVRRFNWLDYTTADLWPGNEPRINGEEIPFGADNLTRMVLNPDVTVRSRGVIEKCSFCVQRIQEAKLTAKMEGRRLKDDDVRSACSTACPTGGITFGDRNNKGDKLDKVWHSDLNYIALEQTNVRSSVKYAVKVVNKPDAPLIYDSHHGDHGKGDHGHGEHDHDHEGEHDHSHDHENDAHGHDHDHKDGHEHDHGSDDHGHSHDDHSKEKKS